jgi:hypothetical protein
MINKTWVITIVSVVGSLMSGCTPSYSERWKEASRIVAVEAEKVSRIQIGMTIHEVQGIMGTNMIEYDDAMEARPIRRDKFVSKDGIPVEVFYYRSSIKKNSGLAADDETTAIVFIKGKVDTITSGESSKTVFEIRSR